MESTTLLSTPPDQVDNLIKMVAEEAGLSWQSKMETPAIKSRVPAAPTPQEGIVVDHNTNDELAF